MTIRMRHTRSHTANRRSHHALKKPALVSDKESNSVYLRHRMDPQTGKYKGRVVEDVYSKIEKKQKRIKEKNKALGIEEKEENSGKQQS